MDEGFHVSFNGLDAATKEAADQMIGPGSFWLLAHSIIGPSDEKTESSETLYLMYFKRTGEDLLAAPCYK